MGLPVVNIWNPVLSGGAVTGYRTGGRITGYTKLGCEPSAKTAGTWSMTIPTPAAVKLLPGSRVTVDWDGRRWATGRILTDETTVTKEEGEVRTVTGETGIGLFRGVNCWPNPDQPLGQQTSEFHLYSGNAETVIRALIVDNYRTHEGLQITIGANANQGEQVKVRARMTDLLTLVQKACRIGGVVCDVGLIGDTVAASMHADVRLPVDRSAYVVLSAALGSLKSWTLTDRRPDMTRALVGGGGEGATRVWARVTTAASDTAAARWGGHVEKFVDGGEVFDLDELSDRGKAAVRDAMDGALTLTLEATTGGAQGLWDRAGLGDAVGVDLGSGRTFADDLNGLKLEVDQNGPKVSPVVGDPDSADANGALARMVAQARGDIRQLQTTRERSA